MSAVARSASVSTDHLLRGPPCTAGAAPVARPDTVLSRPRRSRPPPRRCPRPSCWCGPHRCRPLTSWPRRLHRPTAPRPTGGLDSTPSRTRCSALRVSTDANCKVRRQHCLYLQALQSPSHFQRSDNHHCYQDCGVNRTHRTDSAQKICRKQYFKAESSAGKRHLTFKNCNLRVF